VKQIQSGQPEILGEKVLLWSTNVQACKHAGLLIWNGPFLARRDGPPSGDLCGPYVARLAAEQALPLWLF